jgi:hypothetical protein
VRPIRVAPYIVYPSNRHLGNMVRVFVDGLVKLPADWRAEAEVIDPLRRSGRILHRAARDRFYLP